MKKYLSLALMGVLVIAISCNNNDEPIEPIINPDISEESFLPMHIGNYWKNNEQNFTEITDTLRIQGNLYYKFYSLIGGDGFGTRYLRIDDEQNLIERDPDYPDSKYIHAQFNAQLGSTFWTINDQSVNDFKTTVIEKEDATRTFELQRVYHPNVKDIHTVTYIKGLGWNNYNEIKINGKLFKF